MDRLQNIMALVWNQKQKKINKRSVLCSPKMMILIPIIVIKILLKIIWISRGSYICRANRWIVATWVTKSRRFGEPKEDDVDGERSVSWGGGKDEEEVHCTDKDGLFNFRKYLVFLFIFVAVLWFLFHMLCHHWTM